MAIQQTDKETNKTTERPPGRETYAGSNRETTGSREPGTGAGGPIGSSGSTYGGTSGTEREQGSSGQRQARGDSGSHREYGQGAEGFSTEYERSGGRGGEGFRGGRMARGRYGNNMTEEWTQKAEEALHPIEEYVREKPVSSLMIAAGIGAMLGLLFFRR